MSSKVQLLKDAVDVHSTLRYFQRKLNLTGFRYRRMCTKGDEFDALLEAKTAGKEKLEVNNEIFYAFVGEPDHTKTVEMLQFESKPEGFLDSRSSCLENLNSSLEVRELSTRETVWKGPLETKPRGLLDSKLSCQEFSNSVSGLENPGISITAQQKVSELEKEGFFEIKNSCICSENLELSPECRKPKSDAQLESNCKSCEDRGDTKTLRKKRLETEVAGFLDRKSSCDENSEFSSEVRRPQLTKAKPVQRKDLQIKPESSYCIKYPSLGNQDSFSHVPKREELKTIQPKDLGFKSKSFKDSKNACHENQDPSMPLVKSPLAETVQPNTVQFKADGVHCNNCSSHEDSKHSSEGRVPRNARKARKKKNLEFKSQGFHYRELPCNGGIEAKNEPEKKKPVQTKKSTPVHREICKVPSWRDDEVVRAKLSQRRFAVCDKIEKELLNQYGKSLRNLRRYMVIDELLKEVNLL